MKILDILKDWRVLIYTILGVFSIAYVIYALTSTHVVVSSSEILPNNSIVYKIDNCYVKTAQDFYSCIQNKTLIVYTNKGNILVEKSEIEKLYKTKVREESIIKWGIDLAGGIRVILKPVENITYEDIVLAAYIIEKRLNAYGLKSLDIKVSQDTLGNKYIIVELPQSEANLIKIIKREGKFEAKIGNVTVFTGKDIISVHTYPPEGGIETCFRSEGGWVCRFYFVVYLSKEAAERFAKITKNIPVVFEGGRAYLKEELVLYIDNKEVDRLKISAELRGKVAQRVKVTGPGFGRTRDEAIRDANERKKELATILSYGSLPTTFEVVRIEKIPPTVGKIVFSSILIAGILAFLAVSGIIISTYRKLKAALLIIVNMIIELFMTIAIGILVGQTFDLPAIAGVLIAIGTGVDDQIITVEEILRGKRELNIEKKVWKILFIVISSFLTLFFAMFPLLFAGLGLLRGFAVMTIIGAAIGAFITRPAFVKLAEKIL